MELLIAGYPAARQRYFRISGGHEGRHDGADFCGRDDGEAAVFPATLTWVAPGRPVPVQHEEPNDDEQSYRCDNHVCDHLGQPSLRSRY